MATLNLSCPCGATLAYTGTESYLAVRSRDWQTDHLGHTTPPAVTFGDVAELRASLVDKLRDAGRELAAELKADLNRQTAAEWAAYDGIQGHQLLDRPRRLCDDTPHTSCTIERDLAGYVAALRRCVAAYARAGFPEDASDVDDLADDLAALLAGRPLGEIVRGFYGQPDVPDPTGPEDRPVGYGVRRHHPIEENPDRVGPPTTVGPGTSGHLEVLMGPGETITIRTDPARVEGHPDADPMIVLHGRLVAAATIDGTWTPSHLRIDSAYAVHYADPGEV